MAHESKLQLDTEAMEQVLGFLPVRGDERSKTKEALVPDVHSSFALNSESVPASGPVPSSHGISFGQLPNTEDREISNVVAEDSKPSSSVGMNNMTPKDELIYIRDKVQTLRKHLDQLRQNERDVPENGGPSTGTRWEIEAENQRTTRCQRAQQDNTRLRACIEEQRKFGNALLNLVKGVVTRRQIHSTTVDTKRRARVLMMMMPPLPIEHTCLFLF